MTLNFGASIGRHSSMLPVIGHIPNWLLTFVPSVAAFLLKCIRICFSVCHSLETFIQSTKHFFGLPQLPELVSCFARYVTQGHYENVETGSSYQLLCHKLQINCMFILMSILKKIRRVILLNGVEL